MLSDKTTFMKPVLFRWAILASTLPGAWRESGKRKDNNQINVTYHSPLKLKGLNNILHTINKPVLPC